MSTIVPDIAASYVIPLQWVKRKHSFRNLLVLYGHCPNSFIPQPLCQTSKRGKKVLQTILASPTPPPPFGQCPYGNTAFQKGASLKKLKYNTSSNLGADAAVGNVKTVRNVDREQQDRK